MLIYKKIPAIMAEVGAIEKSRKGDGINYKFRGIDDIYFVLQPLLSKHGVFYCPNVIDQKREERATKSGGIATYTILLVEYRFYAEDESSVKITVVGEAMDTSDKSSNKAMSAALKVATLQLFCIPTEEEKDTEYQNHEPVSRPAAAKPTQPKLGEQKPPVAATSPKTEYLAQPLVEVLRKAAKDELGLTEDELKAVLKTYGVKGWESIPINQLAAIKESLRRKAGK